MALGRVNFFEWTGSQFVHETYRADFAESLSDIILSPYRNLFGHIYQVESKDRKFTFHQQEISTSIKIRTVALSILACTGIAALTFAMGLQVAIISAVALTTIMSIGFLSAYLSETRDEFHPSFANYWVGKNIKCNLNQEEAERVRLLCQKSQDDLDKELPRAKEGTIHVYFPPQIPTIVLKRSTADAGTRTIQMIQMKEVLKGLGCQCLTVPDCYVEGEFQVETRLPINTNDYHNMGLYMKNAAAFDHAVTELTRLFSKYYLTDLISEQCRNPLSFLKGLLRNMTRYDNLPLYIENGEGKIGLIDLEHLEANYNIGLAEWSLCLFSKIKWVNAKLREMSILHRSEAGLRYQRPVEELVRIFPLHKDLILKEAKKHWMYYDLEDVEEAHRKGMIFFEEGYSNFVKWLKEKQIPMTVEALPFSMSDAQSMSVKAKLKDEILKINRDDRPILSDSDRDSKAEQVANTAVEAFVKQFQEVVSKDLPKGPVTESEIVNLRSKRVIGIFEANEIKKLCPELSNRVVMEIIPQLLVDEGVFYDYDPGKYSGGYAISWMRY